MAADYNKPVTTDNYADILTQLRDNIAATQNMLDDLTGVMNIPTGALRYDQTAKKLQVFNGTTFVDSVLSAAGGGTGTTTPLGTLAFIDESSLGDLAFVDKSSIMTESSFMFNNATKTGKSLSVVADLGFPVANINYQCISPNGEFFHVVNDSDDDIYQYSLSTPFDLDTAVYSGSKFSLSGQTGNPSDIKFSGSGLKMFAASVQSGNLGIYQYTLTTAFDVTTASYDGVFFNAGSFIGRIEFNSDGTKLYSLSSSLHRYDLSTAYDISTMSFIDSLDYQTVFGVSSSKRNFYLDFSGGRIFLVTYNVSNTRLNLLAIESQLTGLIPETLTEAMTSQPVGFCSRLIDLNSNFSVSRDGRYGYSPIGTSGKVLEFSLTTLRPAL